MMRPKQISIERRRQVYANFLSIQIVAGIVFTIFGVSGASPGSRFHTQESGTLTPALFLKRFALSLVLLLAVGLFMTRTLYSMISERRFQKQLESVLNEELRARMGVDLLEVRTRHEESGAGVVAVVRTPQELLPADVKQIEERLNRISGSRMKLVIRSIISNDTDADGPVFITEREKLRRQLESSQTKLLADINRVIEDEIASAPGASLVSVRRNNEGKTIIASVRTPSAIKPEQVRKMQETLRKRIDPDVRLVLRSILTRDADADHYLYEATSKDNQVAPTALAGETLDFHRRLEAALKNQVGRAMAGASLMEFRHAESSSQVRVLATVRTPHNFAPEQVHTV
ncbi:MAG: hypothetical protein AB9873_16085 [Syntrophobacteraceae bacterium]